MFAGSVFIALLYLLSQLFSQAEKNHVKVPIKNAYKKQLDESMCVHAWFTSHDNNNLSADASPGLHWNSEGKSYVDTVKKRKITY